MSSKSKKSGKSKKGRAEGDGVLFCKAIGARNLAAMDKGGTSDPYCVITNTFNKQRFKTKAIKKTLSPEWNQEFQFFVSKPSGHVVVKLWDRGKWSSDDFLGEVAIPLKQLENGAPVDEWYQIQNEPKKKDKSLPPGEVRIVLHFPAGKKENSVTLVEAAEKTEKAPKEVARPKTMEEAYELGKELGRGGFSIVRLGTNKITKEEVAVKIIQKNAAEEEELRLLQREMDIMYKLKHKNIITLIDVFDEKDSIYLILELVTGGELFDQIVQRGSYSERDAASIVKQILEAVEYLHSNGIAHRDLKPENLLCSGKDGSVIKVTDFGLSKDFGQAALQTSCGTPDYVAPEVLKGMAYDNSVDIWSLGVITYILLCGFPPFYGNNDQQIFEKIMKAEYDFPSPDWDGISKEARDFITSILILDPAKRPTASEALESPWLKNKAPTQALTRLKSFRDGMTEYNAKRKRMRN